MKIKIVPRLRLVLINSSSLFVLLAKYNRAVTFPPFCTLALVRKENVAEYIPHLQSKLHWLRWWFEQPY